MSFEKGEKFSRPGDNYTYNSQTLKQILYQDIPLDKNWQEYNIAHDLTDRGLEKFSSDWDMLIKKD